MSLYPSFEDLAVDQAAKKRTRLNNGEGIKITSPLICCQSANGNTNRNYHVATAASLYPSLDEYMGLNLKSDTTLRKLQVTPTAKRHLRCLSNPASQVPNMITPVSRGGILGIRRAEIRPGIHQVILCKDVSGKLGVRIKSIHKGVFVAFVKNDSPAAYGGLRFGDQILQVNNETVAGYSGEKVMKIIKGADPQSIRLAIRDRPYERNITLQKDNVGKVGFMFKNGKVTALVKHSSASRNGLLTDQYLCEINGQCVVGLKDKEIEDVIFNCGPTVTITLMPPYIYEHIVKSIGNTLRRQQDHSIPDV